MLVIRQGKFTGGDLILPEYRVATKVDTGGVFTFRNMQEVHANTAINKVTANAMRCSLVFYCRDKMHECGTPEEELQRAKNKRGKL